MLVGSVGSFILSIYLCLKDMSHYVCKSLCQPRQVYTRLVLLAIPSPAYTRINISNYMKIYGYLKVLVVGSNYEFWKAYERCFYQYFAHVHHRLFDLKIWNIRFNTCIQHKHTNHGDTIMVIYYTVNVNSIFSSRN